MDKKEVLLRDSIDVLKRLREELQGEVEERVIQLLDTAIDDLTELEDSSQFDAESARLVLVLIAEVIGRLPSVIEAVSMVVQMIGDATSR